MAVCEQRATAVHAKQWCKPSSTKLPLPTGRVELDAFGIWFSPFVLAAHGLQTTSPDGVGGCTIGMVAEKTNAGESLKNHSRGRDQRTRVLSIRSAASRFALSARSRRLDRLSPCPRQCRELTIAAQGLLHGQCS